MRHQFWVKVEMKDPRNFGRDVARARLSKFLSDMSARVGTWTIANDDKDEKSS